MQPAVHLPSVTLCAIDTRAPVLAWESLQRSMTQIRFGRAVLFTHDWAPPTPVPGLEIVDIGPVPTALAYSQRVLRDLPGWIDTPHVLVTQWDGFVIDGRAWRDEFLLWDYVGAPWVDAPPGQAVGNGGFSLRSRRLLDAGATLPAPDLHPEDLALCRRHRARLESELGVRFAPPDLAAAFAFENRLPRQPTLGFHGPYNLARVLDEATLLRWLAVLPSGFFAGRDARRLARALLGQRMARAAAELLRRRRAAGRDDLNTRALSLAAALLRPLPARMPERPKGRTAA